LLFKPCVAPLVPLGVLGVLSAIECNREAKNRTVKIQDEQAGGVLAAKINAKLSVAQLLPEPFFDIRRIAAKSASRCRLE